MDNYNLITKAIQYIQKNPRENLSLQQFADNAGFSLTYFDLLFKRQTGYSPVEYSRVYKLTRAALELRRNTKSIFEIALDYGYASPESFTRAFKSFYSLTPSDYRLKHDKEAITWHDIAGRISNERFNYVFPEMKRVNRDTALDYLFTHNPVMFAEDVVGLTVTDTEISTLDDPEQPESFFYVSDYNNSEPYIDLICSNENDALQYLGSLSKLENLKFGFRKAPHDEWDNFDAEIAKHGINCRKGFDMIYLYTEITVPLYEDMEV